MFFDLPDNILPLYLCAKNEFDRLLEKGYLQVRNNKFVFIKNPKDFIVSTFKKKYNKEYLSELDQAEFLYRFRNTHNMHVQIKCSANVDIDAIEKETVDDVIHNYKLETVKRSDAFICKLCALLVHKRPMPWDAVINAFDLYNPANCRFSGRSDTKISKKLLEIYKIATSCE